MIILNKFVLKCRQKLSPNHCEIFATNTRICVEPQQIGIDLCARGRAPTGAYDHDTCGRKCLIALKMLIDTVGQAIPFYRHLLRDAMDLQTSPPCGGDGLARNSWGS